MAKALGHTRIEVLSNDESTLNPLLNEKTATSAGAMDPFEIRIPCRYDPTVVATRRFSKRMVVFICCMLLQANVESASRRCTSTPSAEENPL